MGKEYKGISDMEQIFDGIIDWTGEIVKEN